MIIEINQNKNKEWEIYGETYDSPFKAISKVISKESSKHDELDIQLNFKNGLTQLRNHKGELYPEEYKNNTTCKEVVRGCPVVKSSCKYPSCKLDMACEKTKEELSRKKIRYINRTRSGKYAVQKHMDGENIYYGSYNSKEEAERVVERLLECNWDKEQLETILREEGIERSIRE